MPLDPAWRPVARELPDARAHRSLNETLHRLFGWMERVFCVNCGAPGGMISKGWAAHVFHLCDDCVATHGQPAGLVAIPESMVRDPRSPGPPVGLLVEGV